MDDVRGRVQRPGRAQGKRTEGRQHAHRPLAAIDARWTAAGERCGRGRPQTDGESDLGGRPTRERQRPPVKLVSGRGEEEIDRPWFGPVPASSVCLSLSPSVLSLSSPSLCHYEQARRDCAHVVVDRRRTAAWIGRFRERGRQGDPIPSFLPIAKSCRLTDRGRRCHVNCGRGRGTDHTNAAKTHNNVRHCCRCRRFGHFSAA